MTDPLSIAREVRDLEPVWVTRSQLREIVQRLLIAEGGMKIEQARIHADIRVTEYINELKRTGQY